MLSNISGKLELQTIANISITVLKSFSETWLYFYIAKKRKIKRIFLIINPEKRHTKLTLRVAPFNPIKVIVNVSTCLTRKDNLMMVASTLGHGFCRMMVLLPQICTTPGLWPRNAPPTVRLFGSSSKLASKPPSMLVMGVSPSGQLRTVRAKAI